jgi:putative heme degradation protein
VQPQIDLSQQTSPDDLPDQAQNQMFPSFCDVTRSNVDNRTPDTFSGRYNDVVVFGDLERVQGFTCGRMRFVENTDIDGIRDGIVNQFAKNETILAVIKQLHGLSRNRETIADVWVVLNDLNHNNSQMSMAKKR